MRYSSRHGPHSYYELTNNLVLVPGMTITRFWDDAPLLILGHATCDNTCGATSAFRLQPTVDGVALFAYQPRLSIANGGQGTLAFHALKPITHGIHTIALTAAGHANAGDYLQAGSAELIVLQLPEWDDHADIITL
jgi:hypothetical protein